MTGPAEGLVVVDKPAGCTSHDVVARLRRLAGTRRVGHAGTLDPMATGVLLVGVGRVTRLLGHLAGTDKEYEATIRLGVRTDTDDAAGTVVAETDPAAVSDAAVTAGLARLTGELTQVPPAVSAVKVAGVRSYRLARAGQAVALAPRQVTVERLLLTARRGADLDVTVVCSSGTYVRALARDLGADLGVGAHLVRLRRTRVGGFTLREARTLDQLAEELTLLPLGAVLDRCFPRLDLTDEQAGRLRHGGRLPAAGLGSGPHGAFAPDGSPVALVAESDGAVRPVAVFG